MSVAVRKPMTLAKFLAWDERQELRWEFDGFGPVAMTGNMSAHGVIGGNVRFALQGRLAGTRCRVFGPTLKIEVAGRIRYPDAFVACTAGPANQAVVRDPDISTVRRGWPACAGHDDEDAPSTRLNLSAVCCSSTSSDRRSRQASS